MTLRKIVLPDVDTAAVLEVIEHIDGVIRELSLVQIGIEAGATNAGMLLDLARTVGQDVRPVLFRPKEEISMQAGAAWEAGRPRVELVLEVDEGAGPVLLSVLAGFEAIDALDHQDGALLITPASPSVAACRRWLLTAMADQLASGPASEPRP